MARYPLVYVFATVVFSHKPERVTVVRNWSCQELEVSVSVCI